MTDAITTIHAKLVKTALKLESDKIHSVMVHTPELDSKARREAVKEFKTLYGDRFKVKQVSECGDHFIRLSRKE